MIFFSEFMIVFSSTISQETFLSFHNLRHVEELQMVVKYYTVVENKDRHMVHQATSVRTKIDRNPALTATAKKIISASLVFYENLKPVLAFSPLHFLSLEHYSTFENRRKEKKPQHKAKYGIIPPLKYSKNTT